ncbi:hypothetical protein TRICI_000249 [Trichomonascus ciferrii]|uniref:Uncharacterized protein n=1 Tax=Trichomonascus ciferrii TaxID=44093 RepID=A0A642VDV2_9ASCO|nr:hypothetical protein TRICI_000249 [Trichomonascus ciferrii]
MCHCPYCLRRRVHGVPENISGLEFASDEPSAPRGSARLQQIERIERVTHSIEWRGAQRAWGVAPENSLKARAMVFETWFSEKANVTSQGHYNGPFED